MAVFNYLPIGTEHIIPSDYHEIKYSYNSVSTSSNNPISGYSVSSQPSGPNVYSVNVSVGGSIYLPIPDTTFSQYDVRLYIQIYNDKGSPHYRLIGYYDLSVNDKTGAQSIPLGTGYTTNFDDLGMNTAVYALVYVKPKNTNPNITLTSPTANQTLHENSTFTLAGNTKDVDVDDVVTVKYQIGSGTVRNLHSAVSDGATPIDFSKALTYKDGMLYDGATAVTSKLDKDTPHTVSIWSEDGKGGKSSIITRTFFVVPNRPPTLTINPIAAQSELINSNVINVSGNVVDPDNNDVTVTFAINGGEEQTIIDNGPATSFAFNILLNDLRVGANTVVIKAVDSYQSQTAKTLTINKTHNATPVNEAVALYKISAPTGSAKSILLWITRTLGPLQITPEISFTNDGEAENFAPLQLTNTGTVNGLKQDEYAYQGAEDKTNIVLKITYNRIDAASLDAIKQISGVLF